MFAMGARALNRPRDLEIGSKLTDGCVWAYSAMRSGIMPESFKVMHCEDKKNCTFSNDAWVKFLEPPKSYMEKVNQQDAEDYAAKVALAAAQAKINGSISNTGSSIRDKVQEADDVPVHGPQHHKRAPPPPRTAKDFARAVIETNDLPPGFAALSDRKYILRPEAIESVWYMYRISGKRSWQDRGWKMFQAAEKATNTVWKGGVGHSAITSESARADLELNTDECYDRCRLLPR
jgi:mannosyl-oligosaccharide alpha-1,2-mannosidase